MRTSNSDTGLFFCILVILFFRNTEKLFALCFWFLKLVYFLFNLNPEIYFWICKRNSFSHRTFLFTLTYLTYLSNKSWHFDQFIFIRRIVFFWSFLWFVVTDIFILLYLFFLFLRFWCNNGKFWFSFRTINFILFNVFSEVLVCNLSKLCLWMSEDKYKSELDFHFVELYIFLDFTFPKLFEGFPILFQIDWTLIKKLLIIAWNINSFDVETPFIIHNFVNLHSERLYFLGVIK